jgi:hypothetical protein
VCAGGAELSIEKYDPEEDTWAEIHDMCVFDRDAHAEVIDDMIFVIGEHNDTYAIFGVECSNDKEYGWFVCLFVCWFD